MNLSQTKRAIEAREWRVGVRQKRRFNTLLNGYISVKYDQIYDEYSKFFQSLDQIHPEVRDLSKTKTYKKWRRVQLTNKELNKDSDEPVEDQSFPDPYLPSGELNKDSDEPVEDQNSEIPYLPSGELNKDSDEPVEDQSSEIPYLPSGELNKDSDELVEDQSSEIPYLASGELNKDSDEPDILSVVVEEVLPQEPISIDDMDNIINDIINELQRDEHLHAILHDDLVHPAYEDEDEGIGLNVDTELEAIVEPFDYELEVEGFDF